MNRRIDELRNEMKKNKIDFYIVPTADPHLSEYLPEHYKTRAWASGFTGSAGTLIVSNSEAGLWTDGRYVIQAKRQLEGSGIDLYKLNQGDPSIVEWLKSHMKPEMTLGFDGRMLSDAFVMKLGKSLNVTLSGDFDLISDIWNDRPSLPDKKAFKHEIEFTGLSAREKIDLVKLDMEKDSNDNYLIGSLDDICWLYNIRGFDISNNPLLISYALITKDHNYLFTDVSKVNHLDLETDGITVVAYNEIASYLNEVEGSIMFDSDRTNSFVVSKINKDVNLIKRRNITTDLKAVKNPTEIKNLINCQIKDGVAITKFLYWLDNSLGDNLTELSLEDKLEEFRKGQDDFIQISFDSISAYKENAAMMHYKATNESNAKINKEGFYLIDSGGQYIDGTTDITRTVKCGELSDEEITDFTLVLKGHIALSKAVFLEGTTGTNLDILARRPMWEHSIDYKCGTGHGVGYLSGVHEGPHGFSQKPSSIAFKPGMIITNEPGIYKENRHGIRIENTLLVENHTETEFGNFYKFKTISYCPIDMRAVNTDMLSTEEIEWLKDYHREVLNKLSPKLDEEIEWIKKITKIST